MKQKDLEDFLNNLTLDEKIGQLIQINGTFFDNDNIVTGPVEDFGYTVENIQNAGSVLNVLQPEQVRSVQTQHLKHSKIPLLFMGDIIHGFSTIFPVGIAQGCSFDENLVKSVSQISAKEAATAGAHVTFSPMADLVRDPRWGRVIESYGEDTFLCSKMARAAVKGYQGNSLGDKDTLSACVKHFAAYGDSIGGRDYNSVDMSDRKLFEEYLTPYKSAVDAGATMVMTSFNTINSIPSTVNKNLVKKLLRNDWKFDGVVISDWGAIGHTIYDGVAADSREAAQKAFEATIDIDMMSPHYAQSLKCLFEDGILDEKQLNDSVMRILNLKNKLGLFENPYRFLDEKKAHSLMGCKEHCKVAENMVPETSVLLQNKNDILPLKKGTKTAFIGPYVFERKTYGAWSMKSLFETQKTTTLYEAVKEKYPTGNFCFAEGCPIAQKHQHPHEDDYIWDGKEQKMLEDALSAAKNADVVLMALGEPDFYSGEARSRADITIPDVQKELLERVKQVNDNIVVVLYNGRPLDIRQICGAAKAVLEVWFPGTQGAVPIAEMLFGDKVPSGKLSMSFPYCVGQIPVYYKVLPTGHPYGQDANEEKYIFDFATRYIDAPIQPLFPFGYGLSYTNFKYENMRLDKTCMKCGEKIKASIDVTNIGYVGAEEVVQLYTNDPFAYVSRPVKELKGFKRVFLQPNETKIVEFTISEEMLRFYDENMNYTTQNGEIRVMIGGDSTVQDYISFVIDI